MKPAWQRKERQAVEDGPLTGVALQRLRGMASPVLIDWIDNSLSKIGSLVLDSQRADQDSTVRLLQAEREAAALGQALRELVDRAAKA